MTDDDPFADIEPRVLGDDEVMVSRASYTKQLTVVDQLRNQGLETMNRQCRRKHTGSWRVKDIASGIRLVVCMRCGGQTYERMQ